MNKIVSFSTLAIALLTGCASGNAQSTSRDAYTAAEMEIRNQFIRSAQRKNVAVSEQQLSGMTRCMVRHATQAEIFDIASGGNLAEETARKIQARPAADQCVKVAMYGRSSARTAKDSSGNWCRQNPEECRATNERWRRVPWPQVPQPQVPRRSPPPPQNDTTTNCVTTRFGDSLHTNCQEFNY